MAACDQTFEPLSPEADLKLSVFGYLDPSADTQWIRIMPLRPLKGTFPDSLRATATLEDLGTGRVVEMRDSLVAFSYQGLGIGSERALVHDFWTVEPIEAGTTYRFSARWEGDRVSEAVVDLPSRYRVEVWIGQFPGDTDQIRVEGVNHMPFLTQAVRFYDRCGWGEDSVSYAGRSAADGAYVIPIARMEAQGRGNCGRPTETRWEMRIVGSDSIWPAYRPYLVGGLGEAQQTSNVSNAVGFLGGILTRVVPYERCRFHWRPGDPDIPDYCRIHYDTSSAGIRGVVTETRCGDGRMDSVTVMVEELDPDPGAPPEVRSALSDPDGHYEIGGLDPGRRYQVKDSALPEIDPFWGEITVHTIPVDTVVFTPGEQRVTDVEIQRTTYCPVKPVR